MFLPSVTFSQDVRNYKKGDVIEFKHRLTVISGDYGAGKSTLISAIRQCFDTEWSFSHDSSLRDVILPPLHSGEKIAYLDISQDLYATRTDFDFDNIDLQKTCMGVSSGQGSLLQMKFHLD